MFEKCRFGKTTAYLHYARQKLPTYNFLASDILVYCINDLCTISNSYSTKQPPIQHHQHIFMTVSVPTNT